MAKNKKRGKRKHVRKDPKLAARLREEKIKSHAKGRDNNFRNEDHDEELVEILPNGNGGSHVDRRGDNGQLLTNPKEVKKDLALLGRAARGGWNVRRKVMIRRRLEEIVQKRSVFVPTKRGDVVEADAPADDLAIKAAKVLVVMNGQDQADDFKSKELPTPPTPTNPTVNINVNGSQSTITVDSRTVELARIAQRLGARKFLVDGREIPIADIVGSDLSVPSNVQATESDI